ncbi:ATP-binding protein [Paractinoplanes atraurantiacus]|uniref:Transcriptional regulatory protein, C terminal n=1 Tax=Paractinoplanes atraurantiacus TaxID=1036182 RepID=A0A285GQW6_9ACTN|nr:AAA family ATPase [Actinoplanes atraurantiacus]SNY25937.1 Transcriptional regulatory protein, C terminal [Actinoplanes atraurantiacus]
MQILGPLRVWRDGVEVDTGPRQQQCVLALLAARAGHPVGVDELVDLLWGTDRPASALNIVHKYVGTLRRLLEPGLATRSTGSYLHRRGNGYVLAAGDGLVDLVAFRALVERPAPALGDYVEALSLWRGPAGEGLRDGPATPVFAALDDEFAGAAVAAAGLAARLGESERVLSALRLAARMAPHNEAIRAALTPEPAAPADGLIGRLQEAAELRRMLESALAGGSALALVEGEAGVGKTRLIEEVAAEAGRRGALVVWGRCAEGDGAPSMWPWEQAVAATLRSLPEVERRRRLGGDLGRLVTSDEVDVPAPLEPDSGARFRLFEGVAEVVAQAAARQPLVMVIDDLQWADIASLHLFGHLAARLPARAVLVGAVRTHSASHPELTRMLAQASRLPGHRRLPLGPLGPAEVGELVRRETGFTPSSAVIGRIHARTAGNPFFARELARLLRAGEAEGAGVPATVRDAVQDRMAGLDDHARRLLRIAALVGREVDLDLLARVADVDVRTCLARLEPAEALGLLGPAPGNPYSLYFAHDLVRESITVVTPAGQLPGLHLRVADALERADPGGDSVAERVAHHMWAAGPLADPARTTRALVRAGRRAMTKSAFEAAERQLREAVRVARSAGLAELELSALSQLTLVLGMQAGYVGAPLDVLERSEQLARGLGRDREATSFLFTRFTGLSQGVRVEESGRLAQQLREQGETSADYVVRIYGWLAGGMHEWETGRIGRAFRFLERAAAALADDLIRREDLPLLRDLKLVCTGMLGLMTMLYGDVTRARKLFDTMEADAGDDRYAVTFWASFAVIAAAVAGDPGWASRCAERSIAVDPERSFLFLGTYPRLARWWALGMTSRRPDAAGKLDQLITDSLLDPPRSSMTTWYAALAELLMAGGQVEKAAGALDRAERAVKTYGERHSEGMILLLRARLLHVRGEPAAVVRAAAERARDLSAEREAHLFAQRAESLLTEIGSGR